MLELEGTVLCELEKTVLFVLEGTVERVLHIGLHPIPSLLQLAAATDDDDRDAPLCKWW